MNKEFKIIDLTHTLHSAIPAWDGNCNFELSVDSDYKDCTPPDLFRTHKIKSSAGIGTHMDASAHVIPNGRTIDKLTLEELVTDCVVVDVSNEADEDYLITPDVITKFEENMEKVSILCDFLYSGTILGTPKNKTIIYFKRA
jgi:kynurenine formamidase